MAKWTIISKEDNDHIVWVCTFPINSKAADRFALFIGQFIRSIANGLLDKDTTLHDDNDTMDITCPHCGGGLSCININSYEDRVECSRCDYFIVQDIP